MAIMVMASSRNGIHFIFTGGTIDSTWDGKKDTVVPSKHSIVPDYLKHIEMYPRIKFTEVCMKDSRELSRKDISEICRAVEKSPCKRIIILHGTYTMPDTARYLEANLKRKDQTVVLTGSMTPLKNIEYSDAPFNIGYAIAEVQSLKSGVYICMNLRTFKSAEVAKDLSKGRFYSVFKPGQ
jgi:L-asparaginase